MKIEAIDQDRNFQSYNFEKTVLTRLEKIKANDKVDFSIMSIEPKEVSRVAKKLQQKGYMVSISLGYMSVQK